MSGVVPFPRARFEQIASRAALAQAVGETLAEGITEIAGELGMDAHQVVAAVACGVEAFATRHATAPYRGGLIRLVADRIARRAPKLEHGQRHAVPFGRTYGEIRLMQAMSRLVADVDAVLKLAPDIWHASGEPLATCRRLMAEGGLRRCRVCGCSDTDACPGGCEWVKDDLCSRCAGTNYPSAEVAAHGD